MGLFDIFKKKQPKITFETITNEVSQYNPWDKANGNNANDYSTAVFLNLLSGHPRRYPLSPDDFPRYVSYDLGISDPIKFFQKLLKDGYLRKATSTETLATLKVDELKNILAKSGIEAKERKKADLISKIEVAIPHDQMSLPELYAVSDKASDFLEQHADLIKLFRNPYGITYEEYIATKADRETASYNDIVWAIFNRREMFSNRSHRAKRQNEYHKAIFLKSENNLQESMRYFIHTLFYDLNDPNRIIPDWAKKDWDGNVMQIEPQILENLFELKGFFIPKMAEECYSYIEPSKTLVKKNDFARLLKDIFDAKQIDLKHYLPKGCR